MSSKAGELIRRAERGARIVEIREALKESGEEFADRVNRAAAKFGFELSYDKSKVSRLESGSVAYFTAEEALVIASLDPSHHGIEWLVTGERKREPRERKVS